jgi:hypothetical protein
VLLSRSLIGFSSSVEKYYLEGKKSSDGERSVETFSTEFLDQFLSETPVSEMSSWKKKKKKREKKTN